MVLFPHVCKCLMLVRIKNSAIHWGLSTRFIMTSQVRMEKAMEELKVNPYYEKYAEKIAKLQQTSPDEFLQRIAAKEEALRKKVETLFCGTDSRRFFATKSFAHKYVTTPIFYVNAVPHIGHLYTAVLADAISRYYSMQKDTTVLLTTGTDEHGNKVQRAAAAQRLDTSSYCAKVSQQFRNMCDQFDVDYTDFIRTTESRHTEAVHQFWKVLEANNSIYLGKYSGWYCTSEEAFLSNVELKEQLNASGKKVLVSAESGHPVEWTEEDNYKFKLSAFQNDLKHWLKSEKSVQPPVFHKVLTQLVDNEKNFEDISISRPKTRVPWGIPTPEDDSQNIYVWFDALVNYLTSLGYPNENFRKYWPPTVQVVGKDILKFHGIFWPAFLIAAGLEPPRTLLVHSHWTINGKKMSKSLGNVLSPFKEAEIFTNEGLRYYLLRDSVPHNDSNYAREVVRQILNAELADCLGNLVNRCLSKSINPTCEFPDPQHYGKTLSSDFALDLRARLESLADKTAHHYEQFYIHHAITEVIATVQSANKMVFEHKPWELSKKASDPEAYNELMGVISLALECARMSALALLPVVPKLSTTLLDFLKVPAENRAWVDIKPSYLSPPLSDERTVLNTGGLILFKKLRVEN